MELTEQQQKAVDAASSPPRILDPRTNRTYVLVTAELYERFKDLFNPGPLSEDERRIVLQGIWRRANWDDPLMEDYEARQPGKEA